MGPLPLPGSSAFEQRPDLDVEGLAKAAESLEGHVQLGRLELLKVPRIEAGALGRRFLRPSSRPPLAPHGVCEPAANRALKGRND